MNDHVIIDEPDPEPLRPTEIVCPRCWLAHNRGIACPNCKEDW